MNIKSNDRYKLFTPSTLLRCSLLMFGASHFVHAQDEARSYTGTALEEVVVTARKRAESVQDVPISIAAHTGDMLEARLIDSTDKLGSVTPNLNFSSRAASSGHNSTSTIFIRGVGQTDFLSSNDPGVGFYLDGVYYARSVGTAINFLDIERVEVLRGPQGTLFGRNTIGGAIQLFFNKPDHEESGGKLSLTLGRFSRMDVEAVYNFSVSDEFALRVAAATNNRDGYVTNVATGQDLGDMDNSIIRVSAAWQPSENFSATLVYDRIETDENGTPTVFDSINSDQAFPVFASLNAGCPAAVGGPPGVRTVNETATVDTRCANNAFQQLGPYQVQPNAELASTLETDGLSFTMDWNISENLDFRSITSYRDLNYFSARDADNTSVTILHTENSDDVDMFSQEFQFGGEALDGKLKWLVGAYYSDESAYQIYPVFLPTPQVGVLDNQAQIDNQSLALFTQESFSISDELELTVGLRWTKETKEVTPFSFVPEGAIYNSPDNTAPNPGCGPGGACLNLAAGDFLYESNLNSQEVTEASPMVSLKYRFSDSLMGYTSFTQGFKSGGFITRLNVPLPELPNNPTGREFLPGFDPEFVDAYEVGFKSSPADNLRINGAVFLSEYTDMQISVRDGFTPVILNAGEATIKGLEMDFTYLPSEAFEITGGFGYTDFGYDSFSDTLLAFGANTNRPGSVDLGDAAPHTPDWAANLGIAYIREGDWGRLTSRLDGSYRGDVFFDAPNTEAIAQASTRLFNVGISYQDAADKWHVTLGVQNITGEDYRLTGNSSLHTSSGYAETVWAPPGEWSLNISRNL